MIEDFYIAANAVMRRGGPLSDLDRYTRLEYGRSDTTWIVRTNPTRKASAKPNGGRSGWGARARALAARISAFLSPLPPGRAPGHRSKVLVRQAVAEDAMGAAMLLTTPRRKQAVDTSELGRYLRLEYGESEPAWIESDPVADAEWHRKALERWLRGDDRALAQWLEEPLPQRAGKAETAA